MSIEVKVASLAGFCFGVKRAYDTVTRLVKEQRCRIYTLGKLIHNPGVVAELEAQGVREITADEIDTVYATATADDPVAVVIRAHGVTREISEKLCRLAAKDKNFICVDCTCPRVKKIHRLVEKHSSPENITLIFGDEKHPEVEGIRSYARGENIVYEKICELDMNRLAQKPLFLVSQTTQNLSDWKNSQKYIKKVCTNPLIFDTICGVTEKRQEEIALLASEVDLMLVIGGRNSSNTNKLYDIAKAILPNTLLIESASELPDSLPDINPTRVGIAAGASTPGKTIEEVKIIMSDNLKAQNSNIEAEDFEQLLDSTFKALNTGDTVTGTVLSVDNNEVKVDIGAKVTGILSVDDLADPTAKLTDLYKPGDAITAVAVRVSDVDGVAMLSRRKIEAAEKWQVIVDAEANGTVLEGRVSKAMERGVEMYINSNRVFIPASHSGLPKDADLSVLVGQTKKVKIIEVNEQRKRAVGSIRIVEREERKAAENAFWDALEEGKHFTGKVKSLTSFGAFVDLGPVDGMVHTTELSWQRIKQPSDVVSVGDTLEVFVKGFDREKKRISLGYKTEETNPWNIFTGSYAVGDTAEVKIVSIMPFGAFAQIVPGVDGLIHISQISAERRLTNPAEALNVGDVVTVKITDINYETQKISLSIKALTEPDEAEEIEDAEDVEEAVEAPAEDAE